MRAFIARFIAYIGSANMSSIKIEPQLTTKNILLPAIHTCSHNQLRRNTCILKGRYSEEPIMLSLPNPQSTIQDVRFALACVHYEGRGKPVFRIGIENHNPRFQARIAANNSFGSWLAAARGPG